MPLDKDLSILETGKAEVLHPGDHLVILAVGVTVYPALDAARTLKNEGIEAAVSELPFCKAPGYGTGMQPGPTVLGG